MKQEHSEEVLSALKLLCLEHAAVHHSRHEPGNAQTLFSEAAVMGEHAACEAVSRVSSGEEVDGAVVDARDCEEAGCDSGRGARLLGLECNLKREGLDLPLKHLLDEAERRRDDLNNVLLLIQQLRANASPRAETSTVASSPASATPLMSPIASHSPAADGLGPDGITTNVSRAGLAGDTGSSGRGDDACHAEPVPQRSWLPGAHVPRSERECRRGHSHV